MLLRFPSWFVRIKQSLLGGLTRVMLPESELLSSTRVVRHLLDPCFPKQRQGADDSHCCYDLSIISWNYVMKTMRRVCPFATCPTGMAHANRGTQPKRSEASGCLGLQNYSPRLSLSTSTIHQAICRSSIQVRHGYCSNPSPIVTTTCLTLA